MDLKQIRTLIDLMKKNGLAVFKLEQADFKITLKTTAAGVIVQTPQIATVDPSPTPLPTVPAERGSETAATFDGKEIKSPMVGTFYAASSPDAEPFVKVGQTVTPETVVCIIEAMKVMNEIKSEVSGTVVEVLGENGKPVQFGQPLFRVK